MWKLYFILATSQGIITVNAGQYDTKDLCTEAVSKEKPAIVEQYKPKRIQIYCLPV